MPSVEENRSGWNEESAWSGAGEEWSAAWGGSDAQWFGSFLPRLHTFLPARTILEIAPGFGRWTRFLADHCDRLIGVDVSERCVDACRARFRSSPKMSFIVNDGRSLEAIDDGSIDLAISLDSLVHVESDVLVAYVNELGRKLASDGVAFIHHSNLGRYSYYRAIRKFRPLDAIGRRLGLVEPKLHWRAFSVTGRRVRRWAEGGDLQCDAQESVNWWTRRALIDCFTVLSRPADSASVTRTLRNRRFMDEAQRSAELNAVYARKPANEIGS